VLVILLVAFYTAMVVSLPASLADLRKVPNWAFQEVGRSRAGTVWRIVLLGGAGSLYYWVRIRPAIRAAIGGSPIRH
jgi:hypothetical protein